MAQKLVLPNAADANFADFNPPERMDPKTYTAQIVRFPPEQYGRKPTVDEVAGLIAKGLAGSLGIRVKNASGAGYTAPLLVYVSGHAGVIEEGDASTQLASWVINGNTLANTAGGRLYWRLTASGGDRTVRLYKAKYIDTAEATKQSTNFPTDSLVATGTRTGDGSITLAEANSSGISGTVTLTYTAEDEDTANILYLDVMTVVKAQADTLTKLAEYVLLSDVANGAHGVAYRVGEITDINTSAAAADGAKVYLSDTPGALAYSAGTYEQIVGTVNKDHATNGAVRFNIGGVPAGIDPNAIHDNVAGEINAVATKATPLAADLILIEDTAASNAKKKVTVGSLTLTTASTRITSGDSPYTMLTTDSVIFCDTDGGAIEVDLTAGVAGQRVTLINCGSSGNMMTVDPNGTETIRGKAAGEAILGVDDTVFEFTYDSTEGWW
ncbi:MAG: hypothetical protein GY851_03430 [bacterium]|nr:hypothetical protein [bacterium]